MAGGNFDLERFNTAQATVFDAVLAELTEGRKRTHWMWFIFPQLRALGHSPAAGFYGIGSLAEARAYHAYPVLGVRLDLCTLIRSPGILIAICSVQRIEIEGPAEETPASDLRREFNLVRSSHWLTHDS